MLRKKVQVPAAGGIHLAIAAALGETARAAEAHVFLKSGKKMVSAREIRKVLALGIHEQDQVEIIVDGEEEEAGIMERIEKILCGI